MDGDENLPKGILYSFILVWQCGIFKQQLSISLWKRI